MSAQQRASRRTSTWGYLAVLGAGLIIGLLRYDTVADPFPLALALLVCSGIAILVRPIAGIYLTLFFSVVGDGATMPFGYPFNFNFSSRQSILYIHDALTFSPAEVFLVLTAVSWFAHAAGARDWRVFGRPLLWPVVAFAGMVGVGFVYGVILRGGDPTIAMWELRPLLYVAGMYLLASNLLTRSAHYVSLAWVVVVAISIQNLNAIRYYNTLSAIQREFMDGLTDHTSSLIYVWVFLLTMAVCMLRSCSPWARFLLLLASIPTAYAFVLSERRAAAVALAAGFGVFAVVLFFRRRTTFFILVPIALVLTAGYSVAFWNATDGVGFGARAVKSVIAPEEASERDSSSDIYRDIENYNLVYTIRAEPLTGVGFGKPFYQPAQLPDISFFVFYQYIPHNSVLWIWLNMGFVGFVALLFVAAATLRAGTRASLQLPTGDVLAVTVGALCFVVMFFVFAYVDIAWDTRTCLFLAVCMATCANTLRLCRAEARGDLVDELAEGSV